MGDGDWTLTRRYYVTQDSNLEQISSQLIEDLGELESGNWQPLVDFASRAISSYPANKYVLILSDHGSGWPGSMSDDDPNPGDQITTNQIDKALSEIINRDGIGQFELVGFDACLMAQLEVFDALAPYTRYAIASEEIVPGLGFAYAKPYKGWSPTLR